MKKNTVILNDGLFNVIFDLDGKNGNARISDDARNLDERELLDLRVDVEVANLEFAILMLCLDRLQNGLAFESCFRNLHELPAGEKRVQSRHFFELTELLGKHEPMALLSDMAVIGMQAAMRMRFNPLAHPSFILAGMMIEKLDKPMLMLDSILRLIRSELAECGCPSCGRTLHGIDFDGEDFMCRCGTMVVAVDPYGTDTEEIHRQQIEKHVRLMHEGRHPSGMRIPVGQEIVIGATTFVRSLNCADEVKKLEISMFDCLNGRISSGYDMDSIPDRLSLIGTVPDPSGGIRPVASTSESVH